MLVLSTEVNTSSLMDKRWSITVLETISLTAVPRANLIKDIALRLSAENGKYERSFIPICYWVLPYLRVLKVFRQLQ